MSNFHQAFTERIKHREGLPFKEGASSVMEPGETTRTSGNESALALCRANSKVPLAEGLKQILEKLTKKFNATCSVNKKIRNEINVFRKERTLYDHVFKNLESLILQEEKKLLSMLKKNNEVATQIKGADENLTNIVETVSKFKNEEFLEVIRTEKERYDSKLRKASIFGKKSIVINLKNPDKVEEIEPPSPTEKVVPPVASFKSSGPRVSRFSEAQVMDARKNINDKPVMTTCEANELRVVIIEKCVKEFKYHVEENSIESVLECYHANDSILEEGYRVLGRLEIEVWSSVRGPRERDARHQKRAGQPQSGGWGGGSGASPHLRHPALADDTENGGTAPSTGGLIRK